MRRYSFQLYCLVATSQFPIQSSNVNMHKGYSLVCQQKTRVACVAWRFCRAGSQVAPAPISSRFLCARPSLLLSVPNQNRHATQAKTRVDTRQSFIRERLRARSNPLPYYIPFLIEKVSLLYLLSTNSLELCIPFTAVNALSFNFEYITKPECFSIFSHT